MYSKYGNLNLDLLNEQTNSNNNNDKPLLTQNGDSAKTCSSTSDKILTKALIDKRFKVFNTPVESTTTNQSHSKSSILNSTKRIKNLILNDKFEHSQPLSPSSETVILSSQKTD